jgi:hypothetical protein
VAAVKVFVITLLFVGLLALGLTLALTRRATPVLSAGRSVVSLALSTVALAVFAVTDELAAMRRHKLFLGVRAAGVLALAALLAFGVVREATRKLRTRAER